MTPYLTENDIITEFRNSFWIEVYGTSTGWKPLDEFIYKSISNKLNSIVNSSLSDPFRNLLRVSLGYSRGSLVYLPVRGSVNDLIWHSLWSTLGNSK